MRSQICVGIIERAMWRTSIATEFANEIA